MLLTEFRRGFRWLEGVYEQGLKALDVTPRQFELLHFIAQETEDGPVKQTALTNASGIDRSTASGMILLLEKKRLVIRQTQEDDQRVRCVRLTAKGREVLEKGVALEAEAVEELKLQAGDSSGEFLKALPQLGAYPF